MERCRHADNIIIKKKTMNKKNNKSVPFSVKKRLPRKKAHPCFGQGGSAVEDRYWRCFNTRDDGCVCTPCPACH